MELNCKQMKTDLRDIMHNSIGCIGVHLICRWGELCVWKDIVDVGRYNALLPSLMTPIKCSFEEHCQ